MHLDRAGVAGAQRLLRASVAQGSAISDYMETQDLQLNRLSLGTYSRERATLLASWQAWRWTAFG